MATEAEPSGPRKTPIASPQPDTEPPPKPRMTPDQEAKYKTLLSKVEAIKEVQCPKEKGKSGPITDGERAWMTRDCVLRYLRATKWHVDEAAKRLHGTLAWRREYGIEEFTADYISPEQETGKQLILGFDRQRRPCQYLNPNRQNTDSSPRQIHHLFFMMERVIEMMPPGVENLSLLINFKPSKHRQNTSVPVSTAREVLHILQNHYPERLGKALIINGTSQVLAPPPFPILLEAETGVEAATNSKSSAVGCVGLLQDHHALHRPGDAREAQIQRGHEAVRAAGAAVEHGLGR